MVSNNMGEKPWAILSFCFETAGRYGLTEQQAVSKQNGDGGGEGKRVFPPKNQFRSRNEEEYRGKVFQVITTITIYWGNKLNKDFLVLN